MKSAFKIALVYALFASLWILLSDRAASLMTASTDVLTVYSSIKGLFFVTVTSLALFIMIRNEIARRNDMIRDLNKLLVVKEELIRELHHRVWNNIQVIIGVLGLETGDEDFSAQAKERIVNRLLSMRSVYNVVYNYENMKDISLEKVLAEYERAESRKIRIIRPVASSSLPIETLVSLLLVLDVILESVKEHGYCDTVEMSAADPGRLELRLGGCVDDLSTLLGGNESFVRVYLKSLKGDVALLPGEPPTMRITYK